jgi:hypothetical protein
VSLPAAPLAAILYILPYFLPFLAPSKRAATGKAYLPRQVFFFNSFQNAAEYLLVNADNLKRGAVEG